MFILATVLTDSPEPSLQFLSNPVVTADHSFIRLHGRNHGWYNYLYSKRELEPGVAKVNNVAKQVKRLRIYFNKAYSLHLRLDKKVSAYSFYHKSLTRKAD